MLLADGLVRRALGARLERLRARGPGPRPLLSFPVERWQILVAKNLGAISLRLPSLLLLATAALFVASWRIVPAVLVVAVSGMLIACAADNFMSILFPIALPAAGRNPHGPASGTRGLGAAAFAALLMVAALVVLVALRLPRLAAPALAAALAFGWSACPWPSPARAPSTRCSWRRPSALLLRREPELLARMLAEE